MPIEYKDVNFTYLHYKTPAVSDINLTIEEGSITTLLGPIGAGKSTLLHMMNGLVPNQFPGHMDGSVTVDGIEVEKVEVAEVAKLLNMVFDDPVLQIVSLTVRDDVIFGPANLGLTREDVLQRATEALRRTRLTGYEARNPRTLSGGEQQLLAIAGVLAMQPKYLVLDEPVAMLDPIGKKQVLEAIQDLHRETGLTVVIAESGADIEALMEFVDRVVVISKGHILADGKPRELFTDRSLMEDIGLRMPQVTEAAYHFINKDINHIPVTLKEGVEFFSHRGIKSKITPEKAIIPTNEERLEKAILVRNLWHTYPGPPPVDALQGINLEINKGEKIALLGQNGSGKTTLAFHLVGTLKPTNKDAYVEVAGLDVVKTPQFELIQRANYVFQNPANQLFNETFEKEVKYGPERLEMPPDEVERRAKTALEQVGLGHLWEHSTFNISKSLETLLGLASVLSLNPEILILDEPTGGLDKKVGLRLMDSLEQVLKDETVIMITHDMALASRYAQRIIVLQNGKILVDGPTREVFSQPEILSQAMLQPPQITQLAQQLGNVGYPPDIMTTEEFIELVGNQVHT